MNRRRFLALSVSTLVGAGCLDQSQSPSQIRNTSTSDSDTHTSSKEHQFVVTEPRIQEAVFTNHFAFVAVQHEPGRQYVVVNLSFMGEQTPKGIPEEFTLRTRKPDAAITSLPVADVESQTEGVALGFPVSAVETDAAEIYYTHGERATVALDLPDSVVKKFPLSPSFEIQSAKITDVEGKTGITFSVKNAGERDGVYRAIVTPDDIADVTDPIWFAVPKNQTVTETVVPPEIADFDPSTVKIVNQVKANTRYYRVG